MAAATIGAALATTVALVGCHTNNAQTTKIYTAPAGTDVRTGLVKALNIVVVDNGDGTGTIVTALVNTDDELDQLVQTAVSDPTLDANAAPLTVSEPDQPIDLPPGQLVQLVAPEVLEAAGGPIVVSGDTVEAGAFLRITFTFAQAGPVTGDVPVVSRGESDEAGEYDAVPTAPPEPPEPSDTPEPDTEEGGGGRGRG